MDLRCHPAPELHDDSRDGTEGPETGRTEPVPHLRRDTLTRTTWPGYLQVLSACLRLVLTNKTSPTDT